MNTRLTTILLFLLLSSTFVQAKDAAVLLQSATTNPASHPLLFVQLSDPQFGMSSNNKDFAQESANFEFVIATLNRLKPAFAVITGDLVNKTGDEAQIAEYQRIARKLDPAIHLYKAPGNHDVGNQPTPQSIAAYVREFGPDHFRFREGDFVGLVLNSSLIHTPTAANAEYLEQQTWLKDELQKAKDEGVRYIVLFQHHPIFLVSPTEPDQYFNLPLARRGAYLELLHQFKVTAVFSGHLHQDKSATDGDLDMIVTGAAGKPLGGTRSGLRIAVARDGKIAHRYVDFGDIPNQIDPMIWPNGEMLRKRQP